MDLVKKFFLSLKTNPLSKCVMRHLDFPDESISEQIIKNILSRQKRIHKLKCARKFIEEDLGGF